MTRPGWQEPSTERELGQMGFRADQLERRFWETQQDKKIWAYMVTYESTLLPAMDWWVPTSWEEFACTPDTGDGLLGSSILYPDPGASDFRMWRDDELEPPNPDLSDCYVVEVLATFFDNGTVPSSGEWFAIGNLMQIAGSEGNFDRHIYQPADLVVTQSHDHSFSSFAIRMDSRPVGSSPKFFTAEIGNFCAAQMWVDTVEMQVFRVGITDEMLWLMA